ncbi:murein hydrolase activator EnvC family protein [Thalassobacillus hwangdonensis]|uniref:Murein hydrolase activator EnvC family protein n=1 Tax=Thalassobacillus hwangdonensis TaxID=546108 RepID=A0ABW3L2N0_9BACI
MKRLLTSIITLVMVASTVLYSTEVAANSNLDSVRKEMKDLEGQQGELKSKEGSIEDKKSETEDKIAANKSKQQQTKDKIAALDRKLSETSSKLKAKESEIEKTKAEIEKTQAEIEQLKKEIKALQERIKKREEILVDRLRSLQENGGDVSYLEVLMGAQNFGDFLDRANAVTTIMDQDKNILDTHLADKKELQAKKVQVEEKMKNLENQKAELEDQKAQLENLKADLDNQKAEKEKLMAQLEEEEEHLHDHKLELQEEQEAIRKQQASIQAAMQAAKEQEAEIQAEIKRKEEEARKAREAAKKNNSSSSSSNESTPEPVSTGGGSSNFIWPAAGYVSSGFGGRSLGQHYGIDIAKAGTVPIRAAAGGTVFRSYYSGTYGNTVWLTHYVDGQVYTTIYAHMSSRTVSEGQTVKQGQLLGNMGNTGQSYGQHLHFELHKGTWNASKSNAVNPLPYLP